VILLVPSREADGVLLVEVRGDLDRSGAVEFRRALSALLAGSPTAAVALDLARVQFMDCAGARCLVWAAEQAAADGRSMTLLRPSDRVLRLLRLLRLDRHLLIERGRSSRAL
jgi:anti-anti-sigma factor